MCPKCKNSLKEVNEKNKNGGATQCPRALSDKIRNAMFAI
jgi:predicted Zn-ribbon and HTH transcriptional regulator